MKKNTNSTFKISVYYVIFSNEMEKVNQGIKNVLYQRIFKNYSFIFTKHFNRLS